MAPVAKHAQVGAEEGGQQVGLDIELDERLDAGQPVIQRSRLGKGRGREVGDDPARLGGVIRRQVVRAAGQLGAGRRPHHQRGGVGGHTARQQVRVSEIGQQGQPDPGGQRQRGEEFAPEEMIVVGHVF
jgi:hypothetical protein